jgi:hypothetical protein
MAIFNSFLHVYQKVNLTKPPFSYGFPMVFLWFFPLKPPFSYGFPRPIGLGCGSVFFGPTGEDGVPKEPHGTTI